MGTQQYSLRWNNYLRHITYAFDSLRSDKDLVDVTLSCDGQKVHAHKMLLSACSSYFRDLFKENPCQHPVIIFRNVHFEDLLALVDFMYQGEVNVEQEQLASFLNTAELLQVQGLTNTGSNSDGSHTTREPEPDVSSQEVQFGDNRSPSFLSNEQTARGSSSTGPAAKRRRWRARSSSPVSVTPVVPGMEGVETMTRASSPPVEIVPMKLETPEYVEDEGVSGEDTAEDTLARLRENDELLLTKSSDVKLEQHSFGTRSDTHAMDMLHTTEKDSLVMAGPSNDAHSQESLQDAEGMDLGRVVYRKLGDRFQCQICDCSYARLLNLSRHIIAKHTQNSEGMFTCYICQRWFKTKWSLATHNSRFHPRGSVMESTQSPALQQHPQEPICSDSIEDSKEHTSKMIFPGDH